MPKLIKLPTFKSSSGQLSVLEKKIPFKIKRCYFIYNVSNQRGGHRHKKTKQAMKILMNNWNTYQYSSYLPTCHELISKICFNVITPRTHPRRNQAKNIKK